MPPQSPRADSPLALAVYVERWAQGAAVAVFGDAHLGLAEHLADAGARSVDLWDPDRTRAAAAREAAAVRVHPYPPDPAHDAPDGGLRRGSVDVVVVPDLGVFDDPAGVLHLARAAAGDRGVAVVRATNAESADAAGSVRAFDYYELFDLLAAAFPSVRMIAQLAFGGVALVALGENDDAPAVSVDTQLADGDRNVAAFVAVASVADASVDPYAIIELPIDDAPSEPAIDGAEVAALRGALQDQKARAANLEAAAVGLQERLEREVARSERLEPEVAAQAAVVASLTAEVEALRPAARTVRDAVLQADELARRADEAERRSTLLERELAMSGDAHSGELVRFEQALRERAEVLRSLEAEVARREEIVRELVSSLDENGRAGATTAVDGSLEPPRPPVDAGATDALLDENARLRERLDGLALDVARRESDAQASRWTIEELERRLDQAITAGRGDRAEARPESAHSAGSRPEAGDGANGKSALKAALDELEALRRALAQEHEERARVESGEALADARAEIARLTVLLDQAGHAR